MTKFQFLRNLRPGVASQRRRYLSTAAARDIPIVVAKKTGKKIPRAERKTMVEEFVTKYRALNAGKFPGVGNTMKHVGGSHYTIRSILQELDYNSKPSAIDTSRKSSMVAQTSQDDRINAVNEGANSEMLAGKVPIEKGYGDSGENGVKTSGASMEASFQVAIKLLEEPGSVEKTSPDITEDLKSFGKPDHHSDVPDISRNTRLSEVNQLKGQAPEYNEPTKYDAVNSAKTNKQVGGSELPAVDSINKNVLLQQGAEGHRIPEVAKTLHCHGMTNADSIADTAKTVFTNHGKVDSSNRVMKVDTSILTKTINESVENVSGNESHPDSGPARPSSVTITGVGRDDDKKREVSKLENTSANQIMKVSTMDSQPSAYSGQSSEDFGRALSTAGKLEEASKSGPKCDEDPRKSTKHDTPDNEHQEATSWGFFKSIASFITFWRKT